MRRRLKGSATLHQKKFPNMLLHSSRNKKEISPMPFHSSVYFWNWEDALVTSTKYYTKSTGSIPVGHWIPVTEKRGPTLRDQRHLLHFQAFTPCLLLKNSINERNGVPDNHSKHVTSPQDYYQLPKNSRFLSGTQHRKQHRLLLQQDTFKHWDNRNLDEWEVNSRHVHLVFHTHVTFLNLARIKFEYI